MPDVTIVVLTLFVLAVIVAILLPMAQKAAADPFVDMNDVSPERAAYVDRGLSLYNKFSDTRDVTKGNFLQTTDPSKIIVGNQDLREVSQTSDLVPDVNAPTKQGIKMRGPTLEIAKSNTVYYDTEKCEKLKGRDVCSKLGSEAAKGCGVCIKGGTSYTDPDNPGKHIGGMLLLEEDKQMAEISAQDSGKPAEYMPTTGECPPGYFFADRAACEKAAKREDCKEIGATGGFDGGRTVEGKTMESSFCAAVPAVDARTYVYDPKGRRFDASLRILTPVRSGVTKVSINAGGASYNGQGTAGVEFVIPMKSLTESTTVTINVDMETPYTPFTGGGEYRAALFQWESSDGRIVAPFKTSIVSVNGVRADADGIIKNLREFGTYARSNVILLPRPSRESKIRTDSAWMWSAGAPRILNLETKVPGTFLAPSFSEDRAVVGLNPLITQKSTFEMLRASPCLKPDQKPGRYGLACLKTLFVAAGGILGAGTLSRDGLENLNKYGSAESISGYLDNLFRIATRGRKESGMKATMTEINDAAMKLFGFELVSPCEDISEGPDGRIMLRAKSTPVDADCLDYLWMNTGNDRSRGDEDRSRLTSLSNTYVFIGDRYSGLRAGEGTKSEVAGKPFTTCQRSGTMAPKRANGSVNYEAVNAANNLHAKNSIAAIQNYYSQIHRAANYTGGNKDLRNTHDPALLQCYGIRRAASNVSTITECPLPPLLTPGRSVSFSPASAPSQFARHAGFVMWSHGNDGSWLFRNDATFRVLNGLANTPGTISFEAVNFPGYYIVHMNFRVQIFPVGANRNFDGRRPGRVEAEWKVVPGLSGAANSYSFESNFQTGFYLAKVGDQIQITRRNAINSADLTWFVKPGLI
jgi:hypothetical protein